MILLILCKKTKTNLIAMYNIQKIKNDMEKSFTKPRATVDYASLAIT